MTDVFDFLLDCESESSIKFCSNCGYKIEISSDPKNSNEEIIVSGEIVNTDFKVTSFIKKEKKTWNGYVTFLVSFTITLFILYLIALLFDIHL